MNMFSTWRVDNAVSRPFFPLGKMFFWISLAAAQVAGFVVGECFGGHAVLLMLFLQMLTAAQVFWALYLLALNFVEAIEHRNGIKIEKPHVLRGILYAVLIPLIMCAFGFLIIQLLSHSLV